MFDGVVFGAASEHTALVVGVFLESVICSPSVPAGAEGNRLNPGGDQRF